MAGLTLLAGLRGGAQKPENVRLREAYARAVAEGRYKAGLVTITQSSQEASSFARMAR